MGLPEAMEHKKMEPYIVVTSVWRNLVLSNYVDFIVDESPYEAKKKCVLAHIEAHNDEKYIEKVEAVNVDRAHFMTQLKKLTLTDNEIKSLLNIDDEEVVE